MHTRCPKCQTVFRVTPAQLKMREGMVRCGRCQHAFPADKHFIRKATKPAAKNTQAPVRKRPASKKISTPESAKPKSGSAGVAPSTIAAAPFHAQSMRLDVAPLARRPQIKTRNIYWAVGSALLLLLMAGQALIFYGYEFARRTPALRSAVDLLCDPLPCRRLPLIDMRRMDLVETRVAPHPRYDKALRVKATLVNRAEMVQPYPLLEVSLIDSQGQLVARRTYPPREYLSKPEVIQQGMPPQLAINVQLDITSPGVQASGYEVLLLPPTETVY